MNARELARKIAVYLNDHVEGSEAYVSVQDSDSNNCVLEVAFDDEDQLFRIVVQEENG